MSESEQIEAALAALEAQRGLFGDAVVEMAATPLRARLAALQAQPVAEAQQLKQVTVVFVDGVGSTEMGQRLDPEEIHTVVDSALAAFGAQVQAHGGRVLQYTGDGLLAAFGADGAQEDDPERAVRAGLAILAAALRQAAEVRHRHGLPGLAVRVGINTGPVLLGGGVDAEGSIRGATVNTAARMEQSAPPGSLRIHHDTYRHVRGVFHVSEEPPLLVKGHEQPLQTYLVLGTKPRAFRVVTRGIEGVETRMVARDAELQRLQEAFRGVCSQVPSPSAGAVALTVAVVAEAGLGKSRLLYEFENWAEAQPQRYVLFRGRAEPQTQTQAYGLLRDVLAWRLNIADSDDAEAARRKLSDAVIPLFGEDGEAQAHLLGQLIGLDFSASPHVRGILDDAKQIRSRGFHAAAQLLRLSAAPRRAKKALPNAAKTAAATKAATLAQASNGPMSIVVLLDDLHWADDGSLDFISYLRQVNADVPTLLLCMTRPTLFERRPHWAGGAGVDRRIELEPLDKRGSRELADMLLHKLGEVPAALRELVTGGAEGNPFYMEELVRMLIDNGAILVLPERWQVVADKLLALHVPATLIGVLQARLDSLSPAEKHALQLAAVIGLVFWDEALAALDAGAAARLGALVKRGLVVPREQSAIEGQQEYAFKHQILHQVTYDSILKRQRREHHAQAAAWLAQLGGSRAGETLGPAAEHYERAGDSANARRCFTLAAESAAARYANEAMLGYVARALALADLESVDSVGGADDAQTRWRLLTVRENHLIHQPDRAAHAADLDALAALAEAASNDAWRAQVLLRRAATLNNAGDHAAAEAVARRGLALSGTLANAPMAVGLYSALAAALIFQGNYGAVQPVVAPGLALARKRHDRAGESSLINVVGMVAMEQGDLTAAAEHFERSLAIERKTGNRAREGLRLNNLGSVYPRLGHYERASRHLADGLRVARATGRRDVEGSVLLNMASVAHLRGDDALALTHAESAHAAAASAGQRDLEAYARLVAGHAELGLGRFDAARAAYAESAELLKELKMRSQQVLDPISGLVRVALAQGRPAEALAQAEAIVSHLQAGGSLDGTEEPLLIPLTCYQALAAAGDARAAGVLAAAHAELQAQALRIGDAAARESFLHAVPHHRDIVDAWQRSSADRHAISDMR